MSSTKRQGAGQHGTRTPNSVAPGILVGTPVDSNNTPIRTRCVKFGSASAAEFEKDDPPQGSLTPMPPTKAALRFPTDFREPDPETADLIAMTKENSATLAEWEFFDDDGEDNFAHHATQSPLEESRRSRRESGRFIPFGEADSFLQKSEDDAEAEECEMDVGKTFDRNGVRTILISKLKTRHPILTSFYHFLERLGNRIQ